MPHNIDFTNELDARIRELDSQQTPIVKMCAELGLGRHQLLDRRKVLGLPMRFPRNCEPKAFKAREVARQLEARAEPVQRPKPLATYLSITPGFDGKLLGNGCSFPMPKGGFCDEPRRAKEPGRPQSAYCDQHHERCHRRPGKEDLSEVYMGPRSNGVGSAIVR